MNGLGRSATLTSGIIACLAIAGCTHTVVDRWLPRFGEVHSGMTEDEVRQKLGDHLKPNT